MATQSKVRVFLDLICYDNLLTCRRITLVGDAAHLMAPFAGVGVNVAMKDALDLAHAICRTAREKLSISLRQFEIEMWKRAKQDAEATMMYLDLFFNKRGGIAMVEHVAKKRQEEAQSQLNKDRI